MTFSLHQGGVVKSNQIKHTHSHQDTPLSPYTLQLSVHFQQLRPFYSLSQPHHVTHPSPLHVITTRAREGGPKEHRAKQRWPRETYFIIFIRKSRQCKALRERLTPYQSEDPNPTTPTHRMKEEKGKTAGDKK